MDLTNMMQIHEFSPVSEDCRIAPPLYYYMASSNLQFLETPERVATTLVEQRLLIQSLFVSLSSFGAIILYRDKYNRSTTWKSKTILKVIQKTCNWCLIATVCLVGLILYGHIQYSF